jgi:hypothetical protein
MEPLPEARVLGEALGEAEEHTVTEKERLPVWLRLSV